MPRAMLGDLDLRACPRVVGTVTRFETLTRLATAPMNSSGRAPETGCDIVELRLDHVGADAEGWQGACADLAAAGIPLILTLRHATEGGRWDGSNAERLDLLAPALGNVAALDVEILRDAVPPTVETAARTGTLVIGSYHHFERTPSTDELEVLVNRGRDQGADIVKLATWIREPDDVVRLRRLVDDFSDTLICVLGMGPLGAESRVTLPVAGSCLTYGFLDESAAPGQIAAPDLRTRLQAACPSYRPARA
jgi:3-dehydroquinate dehydratase-1